MQFPKLSIVIPAYNECHRIPATLTEVVRVIRDRGWNAEVVVVDDGSTDCTAEVVTAFAASAPEVRLQQNPSNRGKGYSVRAGLLAAQGDVVMFTDADLSAPMEEAELLFKAIEDGADIGHRHRLPVAGARPPNPAPTPLSSALWPLLQRRHPLHHGTQVR
jgi:glycosyltransferase involved in cell wall biosynthesis